MLDDPLLARPALPTVAVMFLVTLLSVAETYFVSALGTDAIAAASLVVPVIVLMVQSIVCCVMGAPRVAASYWTVKFNHVGEL
ncbi:hypothetical protein [Cupriavidus necator]|uniref:hypothetical protein n=1 Tax=Cupriavidus necator TaxID=106590 RepID=UPI00339D8C47